MLTITERQVQGIQIVELDGEAGSAEAWEVAAVVGRLLESQPDRILFDMTKLTFISSLALGELIRLANDLRRFDCRVALAGMSPKIHEVLRVLKIDQYYEIYPTTSAALRAMAPDSPG